MMRMPTPMRAALVPLSVPSIFRGPKAPTAGSTLQHEATVRAVCNGPFTSHGHSGQHRADMVRGPRWAASSAYCPG
jgi:hypothetical protein